MFDIFYHYLYKIITNFLFIFYQLEYYLEPFIYQSVKLYHYYNPVKNIIVNEIYLINIDNELSYKRKVSNDFLKTLKINYFQNNIDNHNSNTYLKNKYLLINYTLKFNYLYKYQYKFDKQNYIYNLNGNYYILFDLYKNDISLFNYIYDYIYHFNIDHFKSNIYSNKGIELLDCIIKYNYKDNIDNNDYHDKTIDITSFIQKLLGPDKNYHNNIFSNLVKYKVKLIYNIYNILYNNDISISKQNIDENKLKLIIKNFDFDETVYNYNSKII